MLLVIDANELFSLIIRGNKESREIFLSNNIHLIAPEFMLIEFSKNEDEILSKTHRTKGEFELLLSVLEDRIEFIPKDEFEKFMPESLNLLPSHGKDAEYLALALKFNCPVWSEEKLLKTQSKVEILNTKELYSKLSE